MKYPTTAFCTECRDFTEYTVRLSPSLAAVRGTKFIHFVYIRKSAICAKCGKEVYVPEINDENVEAREAAYRKAKQEADS